MSETPPPVALLDACVLVGLARRELLLAAARAGYMRPIWSARIEAEWRSAALRDADPGAEALIDGEIALARAAFPDALVSGWEALEGPLSLPDWNDRHVLAAAIAGEAELLITDNLRDFPRRALIEHGVEAISADAFLRKWAEERPEAAAAFMRAVTDDPLDARKRLKRARLPRFAKEIERLLAA